MRNPDGPKRGPRRARATELAMEAAPKPILELPFTLSKADIRHALFNIAQVSAETSQEYSISRGLLVHALCRAAELEVSKPEELQNETINAPDNLAAILSKKTVVGDTLRNAGSAKRAWTTTVIDSSVLAKASEDEKDIQAYIDANRYDIAMHRIINIASVRGEEPRVTQDQYKQLLDGYAVNIAKLDHQPESAEQVLEATTHAALLSLLARTLKLTPPLIPPTLGIAIETAHSWIQGDRSADGVDNTATEAAKRDFRSTYQYLAWLINSPVRLERGQFVIDLVEDQQTLPPREPV